MTYTLEEVSQGLDSLWVGVCAILVFWMQAGFAMLESGSVRSKNSSNILFKNFIDISITTVVWWLFGYGFAFGSGSFWGTTKLGIHNLEPTEYRDWIFQWAFAGTTMTIVSGCIAERATIPSYILLTLVMNFFIYPPIVHWTWGGDWLAGLGFQDFAGSGIVHLTGGISGLIVTTILGKRLGRFEEGVDQDKFRPHHMGQVALGTFILWMGWYGFNGGSMLGIGGENEVGVFRILVNTTIAAVCCGLTCSTLHASILFNSNNMYDLNTMCNGIIAGLVAITAGCDAVKDYDACIIGIIAGFVYKGSTALLQKLHIDDPLEAFSVHGACGIWGTLAVGLFDNDKGVFYQGSFVLLGWQMVGVIAIVAWASLFVFPAAYFLHSYNLLRISEEDETKGADVTKHGGHAYNIKEDSEMVRI